MTDYTGYVPEVGDLVVVSGYVKTFRSTPVDKECIVEEVLTDERTWQKEQHGYKVSLYATDGEYVGDYWTKGLGITRKKADLELIWGLLAKAVAAGHKGPAWDFAKVGLALGADKGRMWAKVKA